MTRARLRRTLLRVLVALLALLALLQLVPVSRENPPVTQDVGAPPEPAAILRRACYDCHSNETNWPWYAYVAPVSWLVAHDVEEARGKLNFSAWDALDADDRADILEEVAEEVDEGAMPLPSYARMHAGARLSQAERATIVRWADEESRRLDRRER